MLVTVSQSETCMSAEVKAESKYAFKVVAASTLVDSYQCLVIMQPFWGMCQRFKRIVLMFQLQTGHGVVEKTYIYVFLLSEFVCTCSTRSNQISTHVFGDQKKLSGSDYFMLSINSNIMYIFYSAACCTVSYSQLTEQNMVILFGGTRRSR